MDIWEIALGFMDSQVLLTAEKLGIFELLSRGPLDAAGVAAKTGLPYDSAARLLTALCALGLTVRRHDGACENAREAAEMLVPGGPRYIGGMFHHIREHLYPAWSYLNEALFEQASQLKRALPHEERPSDVVHNNVEALKAFIEGMHGITYTAAAEFADKADELSALRSVVDIGGASGAFAIALAERHPRLRATVYDLEGVAPIASRFIRRAGLAERVSFRAGNFWEDAIPAHADAYSLGFILHDWDDLGGSILLDKVAEASRADSILILGEYLLNENRTGPLFVARQDLNMLVAARGRERTAGEYRAWLARFGFELGPIYPTTTGKQFMIAKRAKTA